MLMMIKNFFSYFVRQIFYGLFFAKRVPRNSLSLVPCLLIRPLLRSGAADESIRTNNVWKSDDSKNITQTSPFPFSLYRGWEREKERKRGQSWTYLMLCFHLVVRYLMRQRLIKNRIFAFRFLLPRWKAALMTAARLRRSRPIGFCLMERPAPDRSASTHQAIPQRQKPRVNWSHFIHSVSFFFTSPCTQILETKWGTRCEGEAQRDKSQHILHLV